jgi:hypothetical protein
MSKVSARRCLGSAAIQIRQHVAETECDADAAAMRQKASAFHSARHGYVMFDDRTAHKRAGQEI